MVFTVILRIWSSYFRQYVHISHSFAISKNFAGSSSRQLLKERVLCVYFSSIRSSVIRFNKSIHFLFLFFLFVANIIKTFFDHISRSLSLTKPFAMLVTLSIRNNALMLMFLSIVTIVAEVIFQDATRVLYILSRVERVPWSIFCACWIARSGPIDVRGL